MESGAGWKAGRVGCGAGGAIGEALVCADVGERQDRDEAERESGVGRGCEQHRAPKQHRAAALERRAAGETKEGGAPDTRKKAGQAMAAHRGRDVARAQLRLNVRVVEFRDEGVGPGLQAGRGVRKGSRDQQQGSAAGTRGAGGGGVGRPGLGTQGGGRKGSGGQGGVGGAGAASAAVDQLARAEGKREGGRGRKGGAPGPCVSSRACSSAGAAPAALHRQRRGTAVLGLRLPTTGSRLNNTQLRLHSAMPAATPSRLPTCIAHHQRVLDGLGEVVDVPRVDQDGAGACGPGPGRKRKQKGRRRKGRVEMRKGGKDRNSDPARLEAGSAHGRAATPQAPVHPPRDCAAPANSDRMSTPALSRWQATYS